MAGDYNICLGTAGWGVWHSGDAGRSWTRHRKPFPLNTRIQALVAHPTEPRTVFAAPSITPVTRDATAFKGLLAGILAKAGEGEQKRKRG